MKSLEYKQSKLKEASDLAKKSGGEVVSTEYISSKLNLLFKCKNNHEFSSNLGDVRKGTWCPQCAKKKGGAKRTQTFKNKKIAALQ